MPPHTQALVQRWIERFGEPPVLVDEPLMRRLLDDTEDEPDTSS